MFESSPKRPSAAGPDEVAAEKMRTAFDLFVAGERMMRQNLRRRHPTADEAQIDFLLGQWLQERPGAEHGDALGRPVEWPRKDSQAT